VGFEPTVRLPVRLISSQVPSTNSATLPLRLNQGREDSLIYRLVDGLVIARFASLEDAQSGGRLVRKGEKGTLRSLIDFLLLSVPLFLTEILVIIGELVHGSAEEAH
jgi:hypothetical protein